MKKYRYIYPIGILLLIIMLGFLSCKKQDNWLDIKNNKSDVIPKSLQDLQAVLDNSQVMNSYSSIMGLVGTDNIYIPDANLDAVDATSRNSYLWSKDIYQGSIAFDWYYNYQMVEYANIVLDALDKIGTNSSGSNYNAIKGAALFYRSFAFYQLCQLYCKPFAPATANTDLGIPIRLNSDVNIKSVRATVQQSYDQIINDLKVASTLLPQTPLYKTRPGIVAADALLAKVYFTMGDYANADTYAGKTLTAYSSLLDYNTLKITTSNPFPSFAKGHPEVIYHAVAYGLTTVISASSVKGRVSPDLYSSYSAGDLRKTAFYVADGSTGWFKFKGSYSAQAYNFCGIATNELYLIRAECEARLGNIQSALNELNALLKNRYLPANYTPYYTLDATALVGKIVFERRKEMPFTGNLRWEDLRRLNADSRFATTIQRTYRGTQYFLQPNDNRYVFPIPADEINLSGLQQNPR